MCDSVRLLFFFFFFAFYSPDLRTTRPMLGDGVSTNASTSRPAAAATLCQRVVVRSPRLPMSAWLGLRK